MKAIFSFRNVDSTADLNSRWSPLFNKGFYDGGVVTPVPLQLVLSISPFRALSNDGMIVVETATTQLTVIANQTNYLCLQAIYNANAAPTLQWLILEASVYNAYPTIESLIVIATVNVPALATQITTGMISTTAAHLVDKLGRPNVRGVLTNFNQLPTTGNRPSDAWFVSSGLGDVPSMYVWNGLEWQNITQADAVSSTLTLHRQNLFTNEIHLTDDQADALIGSSGNPPNLANPFVDSADTRIPTQAEKNGLAASPKTILDPTTVLPSSTNHYVQSSREFAVPEELIYASGVGTLVEIDLTSGPVWVGTGGTDDTAWPLFNFYNPDPNVDEEYINSLGQVPRIINIWIDIGKTTLLNPSTMTIPPLQVSPAGFFLTGSLFIETDFALNTTFRLSYARGYNLGSMPPDALQRRTAADAQVSAKLLVNELTQQFPIAAPTTTITLNPAIFSTIAQDGIHDINVYENGKLLQPNDGYFTPIVIQAGVNDKLDFIDTASNPKTATIAPGTYSTPTQLITLASIISLAMNAVTTDIITCTNTGFMFSFTDANGPFTLRFGTGPNASTSLATYLGFTATDHTLSASYTGDTFINRGYVGWYKQSTTVLKLISSARTNGLITVKKLFNL